MSGVRFHRIGLGLVLLLWAAVAGAQGRASAGNVGALAPSGYDRGGRRDPFVSLLRSGVDPAGRGTASRPAGLAGLLVAEVSLKGLLQGPSGFTGLLQGPDMKTYVVHVGDRLADGQVRAITADAVVLLQRSVDPLAAGRDVEVRKRLRQAAEGAR